MMKELSIEELNDNVFSLIGTEWMLITAGNAEEYNTMTASWGGIGWLWNKPVAFVFIRPERYTIDFVDKMNRLTLSFLGDSSQARNIYNFMGSKSGRDVNKMDIDGLSAVVLDDEAVMFAESRLTLVGKKLYATDMSEADFLDKSLVERWYGAHGGMHRMYVVEIEQIISGE